MDDGSRGPSELVEQTSELVGHDLRWPVPAGWRIPEPPSERGFSLGGALPAPPYLRGKCEFTNLRVRTGPGIGEDNLFPLRQETSPECLLAQESWGAREGASACAGCLLKFRRHPENVS